MTSPIITGATADNASVATKLDEARALIEKGWCRGAYCRRRDDWRFWLPRNSYCLQGALSKVGAERYHHLFRQLLPADASLVSFNDSQRTKEPIVALLRKAADLARADAS